MNGMGFTVMRARKPQPSPEEAPAILRLSTAAVPNYRGDGHDLDRLGKAAAKRYWRNAKRSARAGS